MNLSFWTNYILYKEEQGTNVSRETILAQIENKDGKLVRDQIEKELSEMTSPGS